MEWIAGSGIRVGIDVRDGVFRWESGEVVRLWDVLSLRCCGVFDEVGMDVDRLVMGI